LAFSSEVATSASLCARIPRDPRARRLVFQRGGPGPAACVLGRKEIAPAATLRPTPSTSWLFRIFLPKRFKAQSPKVVNSILNGLAWLHPVGVSPSVPLALIEFSPDCEPTAYVTDFHPGRHKTVYGRSSARTERAMKGGYQEADSARPAIAGRGITRTGGG
jgi:hypothetical protein